MKTRRFTIIIAFIATLSILTGIALAHRTSPKTSIGINQPVRLKMPIKLTGIDLVSKVFGVLNPTEVTDEKDCIEASEKIMNLVPSKDEYGLWLEKEDGFSLAYYGSRPEASAMAGFDEGKLARYGFFFYFPYSIGERESANFKQASFSGALLQELNDIGLIMEAAADTPALFDVAAEYGDDLVELRLIEEVADPDASFILDSGSLSEAAEIQNKPAGRFLLVLTVEPGATTKAD